MKKKMMTLILTCFLTASALTVCAATTASFSANNVPVIGTISCTDTNDNNPLTRDSVTATTTSSSAMDIIKAEATIYYAIGSNVYSEVQANQNENATTVSVTAHAGFASVGFRGTGSHYASHNGHDGSGATDITW